MRPIRKVLVISDAHGSADPVKTAILREQPFDIVVSLGDFTGALNCVYELTKAPVVAVAGNCDLYSSLPPSMTFSIGPHRVLAVHGHYQQVRYGYEFLAEEAVKAGCDVVMFGHTHVPVIDYTSVPGLLILNPGSIALPKQEGLEKSYMTIDVDENGKLDPWIRYL